jgi:hypothetical protein
MHIFLAFNGGMTMYQIGQCIVYRNVGVCRVEAIGKFGFTSDKDKEYYTLQPLNANGNAKIYVPVDKDTFMRNVITKDEVYEYLNKLQFLSSYFIMVKKQLRRKTYAGTVTFYTIKGMDE